jgi:DNA polymerase I-like protein with 3'-5' exonuclease and polymerase domains
MRAIAGQDFSPSKTADVRRYVYDRAGARPLRVSETGVPSTDNLFLEAYRGAGETPLGRFCTSLLRWRVADKIDSTYLSVATPDPDGRKRYDWKPFGTVSGRLSGRLQSCPRYSPKNPESRVREIYVPRDGATFVYFDVSQAEMRLAAYLSADPVFMAACGSDVHAGNARNVFPVERDKGWLEGDALKDPRRGKPYRDISKNLGFAIAYGAEAEKVFLTLRAKGFPITMRQVEIILANLRTSYRVYYAYAEANLARVRRDGFMRTPILGRIRWFGWHPSPPEIANFPVQSALADVVNARMRELDRKLPRAARLVAQIHDACIYDTPLAAVDDVKAIIREVWAEPVHLAGGPLVLPIDMKTGQRWSELG